MPPPKSTSPVTLKDIARVIGITHGAVSLALRNSPRIGEATRKRVQALAQEMGYQPNSMAAGLAQLKRNSTVKPIHAALAWLNFWPDSKKLRSYTEFDSYWQGARACAEKFGYRLEEFVCNDLPSLPRLAKVLNARGISGILVPPGPLDEHWKDFHWEHFAAARLGRPSKGLPLHAVTSDQAMNTILAFDSARAKGYKRIGFVGNRWRGWMFGAGFLWAQQTDHLTYESLPPFLFEDNCNSDETEQALAAWLEKTKPDAILTERPELMKMLEKAGHRVPEDIGVATLSMLDCPIAAGINQNPAEIGRIAILLLVSLINDNDRGVPANPREILIKGSWVDGSSLPDRT